MVKYPIIKDIVITPVNPPNTVSYWVDGITKTRVQFNVDFGPNSKDNACNACYAGDYPYYMDSVNTDVLLGPCNIRKSLRVMVCAECSNGYSEAFGNIPTKIESYYKPEVEITTERCDYSGSATSFGTYIKATVNGKRTTLNGDNRATLRVLWREVTASTWNAKNVTIPSGNKFEVETLISGIPVDGSYEFKAELSDLFYTDTAVAQSGKVVISRLAGGKGVTLFREAKDEGFWVNNVKLDMTDYSGYKWPEDETGKISLGEELDRLLNAIIQLRFEIFGDDGSAGEGMEPVAERVWSLETTISPDTWTLSKGTLTTVSALKMGFVRVFHNNTQKWTKGSRHVICNISDTQYRPNDDTALACHSLIEMSAKVETNGDIVVVPKADMNNGYDIYVSGVFMY